MIEPLARCSDCFRDITSDEVYQWAQTRTAEGARVWWGWQVMGMCDGCTDLEYEIALEESGGESDGC